MRKALVIPLSEKELQELYRILIDRDKDAVWEFLDARATAQCDGRRLNGDDRGAWGRHRPATAKRHSVRRGVFAEYITFDHTRPCLAEPGKIIVVGKPSGPIEAVLPLLNALLPNVISYNPRTSTLVLRRKPGFITLLANEIFITQVKDAEEGIELLNAVRDLLNQTWEQRDAIQARNDPRRTPRPLDVYALLPQTNCRACGEATCMAFAFALLEARRRVDECNALAPNVFAAQRAVLIEMVGQFEAPTSFWRE